MIATGARTKFGRTVELVRTAHVVSSQQKAVLRVVRNLAAFNGVVIVLLVTYANSLKMPLAEIIPLVLTAVLASIPVALPATFTLASALGARALAKLGVLPTRLSAVDETATMTVLCADETGTLTQNALTVTTVHAMPDVDEAHVLALAALASSDGGQDPVDGAIRTAASGKAISDAPKLTKFMPFDPATKMSEATVQDPDGGTRRVVKGAFAAVIGLTEPSSAATAACEELERKGFRVLAVAAGPPNAMKLAGLIALSDPPRGNSAALVTELHALGVRTVMVTGDAPATAAIVAHAVGLDGAVYPPGPMPDSVSPEQFAVFAGVLPEDKYKLVKAFQKGGHTVGMCGDGANDAPARRQAQLGIAVSTATDVAKSAAGMVLTKPGLAGVVAAVKEGRVTFQRILTYTLNFVIKKGPVATCVGIGWRVFGRHEANRSCGEVNDLIVWFLGEGLPSVDLAHCDLTRGEERLEQHGGGLGAGQDSLGLYPALEVFVQSSFHFIYFYFLFLNLIKFNNLSPTSSIYMMNALRRVSTSPRVAA